MDIVSMRSHHFSFHYLQRFKVQYFAFNYFYIKCFCLSLCLLLSWLWGPDVAHAETLAQRVAAFPQWQNKPMVQRAVGDLFYPQWMAGNWRVESTLVDLVAPLAPEIVTPGFEANRNYLQQPIAFAVRFISQPTALNRDGRVGPQSIQGAAKAAPVIADRAFNGLNIARAYLADQVQAVKMDIKVPNRQITLLRGNRQLIATITGRAVETPATDRLITAEVCQQMFRGGAQPYLNQVETTTVYQWLAANQRPRRSTDQPASRSAEPSITADQITAIYLSPQDPQYFQAQSTPVALYRYHLRFFPD
jgi:hypothetical protein